MGSPFGVSTNKSNAVDERIGATDQAQVVTKSGVLTNPNSIGVGKKGNYNSGLDLSKSKSATINVGASGEEILTLTDTFSRTLADVTADSSGVLEKALNAQSSFAQDTLKKLSELSESKQTGGQSGTDKRVVYIAIAALAIIFIGLPFLIKAFKR